jgi:Ca2+-transporting ATPase
MRTSGGRTVMITGDYPGTALAIAREIGLDHRAGCITGPELAAITDDEPVHRVRAVSVFARMVPEQSSSSSARSKPAAKSSQ